VKYPGQLNKRNEGGNALHASIDRLLLGKQDEPNTIIYNSWIRIGHRDGTELNSSGKGNKPQSSFLYIASGSRSAVRGRRLAWIRLSLEISPLAFLRFSLFFVLAARRLFA
jgi:hypothetical protein